MNSIIAYTVIDKVDLSNEGADVKVLYSTLKDSRYPVSFDSEFNLCPSYGDYSKTTIENSNYVIYPDKVNRYKILSAMMASLYWNIVHDIEERYEYLKKFDIDLYRVIDAILTGDETDEVKQCRKYERNIEHFFALRARQKNVSNTAILVKPVVDNILYARSIRMHYSIEREVNMNKSIHLLKVARAIETVATSIAFVEDKIYLQCPEQNVNILKQIVFEGFQKSDLKINLCEKNMLSQ